MDLPFTNAHTRLALLATAIFSAAGAPHAAAQPEQGWKNTAEFSYVTASGNASTSTLGLSDKLVRTWERAAFELRLSGIRAESTTYARVVTSAGPPATVRTDSQTELTAEKYAVGVRLNRTISQHFFYYGSADWKRNRFAGIDAQYSVAGGIGNTWLERDDLHFRTEYAATWTSQEDLQGTSETFVGARLSWAYQNQLTDNTAYTNELVLDQNLDNTKDFRADMVNSLQVAMSSRLALKVSLEWLFDHLPSSVVASDPDGLMAPGEIALAELEKVDTIVTVSLVVNF